MVDCFDACKTALVDLERRVRKYADEDPTELPCLPPEPGQEGAPPKRMPTRQQQALAKLDATISDLQKSLVSAGVCSVLGCFVALMLCARAGVWKRERSRR
jgi:hypothetical protein